MTVRTTIERLAREICWLGFAIRDPKVIGCTKAQYWKRLPESTRIGYRRDAQFISRCLQELPPDLLKLVQCGVGESADKENAK